MRHVFSAIALCAILASMVCSSKADTFGEGVNQFAIGFVTISGATNPTSGIPAGDGFTFTGVNKDYRMGTYEITNDQWNKFKASLGVAVTGNPANAYDNGFNDCGTGTVNVPANNISWFEAVQFVNWLNTSTGHHAAYNFIGTQGASNYVFSNWTAAESAGGTNLFRHKDAYYFLPTEDEWVKAAYWNGSALQTYAAKDGELVFQGNGSNGGWNYYDGDYLGPWNVGSSSEELNGTYDMMGNAAEWMESTQTSGNYSSGWREFRGGSSGALLCDGTSSWRFYGGAADEYINLGFRIASVVPEPSTIALLLTAIIGGLLWWRRRS